MLRHLHLCLLGRPPAPLCLIDRELAEKFRLETYFVWFAVLYLLSSHPTCPPHIPCSTVEFLAMDSQIVWSSQFPTKLWPSIDTSPAKLFWEIRNTAECSPTAFLCFGDWPSSWPAKTDHQSWPFHQACCCPGSLQCIMRRKFHYFLLSKKLFHNTESFERVSLYLCLQSRLKYVALHNLTRWQFASMYFFYFHYWILCTLCSEELGIEIIVREILLSIKKKMGGKSLDVMCSWGLCNVPLQSCWICRGSVPYS